MNDFKLLIDLTLVLFNVPITLYGFTFTFFQMLIFGTIGALFIIFIRGLFD